MFFDFINVLISTYHILIKFYYSFYIVFIKIYISRQ